jgi:uncharacterized protein (DUF1697 family)
VAKFAALLRGINVGGNKKVPMAELRDLLENELGATEVKTLLNSGNAVFYLHTSPKTIDATLTEAISQRFGFDVDVVTRTKGQLESIVAHDPLGDVADDESKYFVAFMPKPPKAAAIKLVLEVEYENGERCALKGRELYIWAPAGGAESEVMKALAKSKAADFNTARNMRTVKKIIDAF